MQQFQAYFARHRDRFIEEWREFLSFKSISADPHYQEDCEDCARWLRKHLEGLGFTAQLWSSSTKPLVYAERKGNASKPVVLFYGHYDVQPVDPLELWRSNPFEGSIRDGRMYARGAEDNKGQVFFFCKALEALCSQGVDLPTIKVLIEGEEESGSQALHAGLSSWRDALHADILMVCDTDMLEPGRPAITMGLRGIAHCEVRVHGPAMDIHSGMYGGVVLNPLQALARILASLHNGDGSVAVPGFYEGTHEPTPDETALVTSAQIDLDHMSKHLGVPLRGGENRFGPLARRGLRPTLEINGVGGGYQGAGGKTVIPSYGMAKLSMRLVAGQDPDRVLSAVVKHLESLSAEEARVEVTDLSVGGAALLLPVGSDVAKIAERAIEKAFGVKPVYIWNGASIPIIPALATASGAAPLLVGFGLDEDNIHSPNESFSLRQFEEGFRYVTQFLCEL
ncbi:MAG: dipeptidase [Pseudomonadota bacterium]|jgi:acetylornithine deacetylase/succinyl-diaminopimelate desuccinylase-like protein